MKITITGGFGFIGSHAAILLHKQGHEINIITKSSKVPSHLKSIEKKLNIIVGDYSSDEILKYALQTDIIIHTACTTVPENSTQNPIYDIETNVIPSIKLISEASKKNIKKIIFISSGGVVYGKNENEFISEKDSTNPISSYGITKLTIEKYLQLYKHINGLEFVSLRISNAYGPFQNYKNNQGVIMNWINRIANNNSIEIWGDGSVIRDYIYIDDICRAIELTISCEISGVYNIGSGNGISLKELANIINEISHS
ncbi:MAG: NAD-dependent epimerase/dehydratase family protein, partial [Bacteroidia bacterium]|nr:NAD-dependent epimerase/dehydratase family protein [Bacteroidia bacterium]